MTRNTYRQTLSVPFKYDVVFSRNVFHRDNEALVETLNGDAPPARMMFFVDEGLAKHWPQLVEEIQAWCSARPDTIALAGSIQLVPGGERIKNDIDILDQFGRLALECGMDRHSYVVIVGGGAVIDAVGFAASTVHRGIRQIRIPTTVLSQNDSAIGVKNGLNRFGVKNFYGSFLPPWAVIIDSEFLKTLSDRDWRSGIAEAFKVGIIKDRKFLNMLRDDAGRLAARDQKAMEHLVARTAELHLEHIRTGGDPFELGSARPLDFGHWAAHRLEDITNYELRHGEAVAIGIAIDLLCAASLALITKRDAEDVIDALNECGLSLWHDAIEQRNADGGLDILDGLEQFRQHLGGKLTLAMPDGLGEMTFIDDLPANLVEDAVSQLRARSA